MIKINIQKAASYYNLQAFKEVYRPTWNLQSVTISYDCRNGLPDKNDVEHYPFKAVFRTENDEIIIVRIWCLTVGYGGAGPYDMAAILDFLGVSYSKEEIYTKRRIDDDGYIRLYYTP